MDTNRENNANSSLGVPISNRAVSKLTVHSKEDAIPPRGNSTMTL